MKSTIYYSKRQFVTEPHQGRDYQPKWDFTEILKAMAKWR